MPSIPLRERLLIRAQAYARRVHKFRRLRQALKKAAEAFSDEDRGQIDDDIHLDRDLYDVNAAGLDHDNDTLSELSSLSSLSSISSMSSLSSIDSSSTIESVPMHHTFWDEMDEDGEEWAATLRTIRQLAAIRKRIEYIQNTWVLSPNEVHKLSQLHLVLVLYKRDDPYRFRRNLRVSSTTFDELVTRIGTHEVFVSSGSRPQLPVDEQLAIALKRFGNFGSNASVEAVAQWAGVSAGMVVKATRRVMEAVLALHDQYIHWPSAEEKEDAKQWVEDAACKAWRDGWVFVDGTLVPLADKPGYHGEAYFDRKSNYSLNVQVCNCASTHRIPRLCLFCV